MRFKSQTHTQDAHIDRYRTRYGQAPAVASEWDWPREDVLWVQPTTISTALLVRIS